MNSRLSQQSYRELCAPRRGQGQGRDISAVVIEGALCLSLLRTEREREREKSLESVFGVQRDSARSWSPLTRRVAKIAGSPISQSSLFTTCTYIHTHIHTEYINLSIFRCVNMCSAILQSELNVDCIIVVITCPRRYVWRYLFKYTECPRKFAYFYSTVNFLIDLEAIFLS